MLRFVEEGLELGGSDFVIKRPPLCKLFLQRFHLLERTLNTVASDLERDEKRNGCNRENNENYNKRPAISSQEVDEMVNDGGFLLGCVRSVYVGVPYLVMSSSLMSRER